MGSIIRSVGTYLPRTVVTNDYFLGLIADKYSENMDIAFDGCETRRHAQPDETNAFMGVRAATVALERAGVNSDDIDFVLCASPASENVAIGDGHQVMRELGIRNATCWHLNNTCASPISHLICADMLIRTGRAKRVLCLSLLNWVNRVVDRTKNYSPVGDAAGAILVEKSEQESLICAFEKNYPEHSEAIQIRSRWVDPDSREVLEFAKDTAFRDFNLSGQVAEMARKALLDARLNHGVQVDWFVAGQPGLRMVETFAAAVEIPMERNLNTVRFTGNVGGANIPVILNHYLHEEKKIRRGDHILLFAPGTGTYAGAIIWKF